MSFASDVLAALARLASFYNGNTYNPTTNPGGMRNGGHRLNFAPSLQDHALVASAVATEATAAAASASAASSSASAAAGSASAASTAKTAAEAAQAAAEAAAAGITWKVSVKAASIANLTLSGTQTVDGVALVANDRVLVKDQSTAANNGIYLVQSGAWTRAADANTWAELVVTAVITEQGTVNADVIFICTSNSGGTLGTTAVSFSRITLASLAGQITGAQVADDTLPLTKLSNIAANTVLLNATNTSANPTEFGLDPSSLLGRGSAGDIAKITAGSGLQIAGQVLNALSPFTKAYESSPITLASATTFGPYTHSLGAKPKLVQLELICLSVELEYSVGDSVYIPSYGESAGGQGVMVIATTTEIKLRTSNNATVVDILRASGVCAGIDYTKWALIIRAFA